jgi:hypothetical protein
MQIFLSVLSVFYTPVKLFTISGVWSDALRLFMNSQTVS